jgi:hypothetical protein
MPVMEASPVEGKGRKSPLSTSLALFRSRLREGCALSVRLFRSLCRSCLKGGEAAEEERPALQNQDSGSLQVTE